MSQTVGTVRSIAMNFHKVSFLVEPATNGKSVRLVLFNDAPNTHSLPQNELAHRSWMVALLQSSLVHEKLVSIAHDAQKNVQQIELGVHIDFDFGKPKRSAAKGAQRGSARRSAKKTSRAPARG